ncbi:LLM class flavin-dependent oxidoreductase [Streptacidiphilus jiangxiensis]|uniref:Flavin-dependent oxidoreductase, luciferase family (Includes alkanesulfonate monooxygenase SsuD and methylene tetrahydromethanopterin reductase) n=1 Tax=Streptacidiphilus jiangxiensis TaxID=235985 RepID=A0A1H7KYG7_STRJI|nr:LLM class flavin-dependent oxidoreductase [Streptacidiphilus jiangxiensis]SEK91782.1 Flavin-dependent oxidoreductase, luciferase family (includes alkanesulfonate monooxygenase SsuD and methylene tetrahydromethanopterin reductase) [Streptacidiphilus jiangxiensis]
MTVTTLRFNQVTPGLDRKDVAARYHATVEMAVFAEERGFDLITLEEHHGAADGWSPAPTLTAAAIAGATRRIPMMLCALITPLYDPLRLAEELTVLDHLSDGRVTTVAGIGYRPAEYELLGVEWKERGRIQDEVLGALLAAWTGEEFDHRGRRVRLTPPPLTTPHPPLIVGGSSKAAVRRAVRLRLPLFTAAYLPELVDHYAALAEAADWHEGFVLLPPERTRMVHCTEDPDRAWATLGEHFLHEARTYASWQTADIRSAVATKALTVEQLRAEGVYCCLTPDECVAVAAEEGPMGTLLLHPMCGGIPVETGWESLRLFAERVIPRL